MHARAAYRNTSMRDETINDRVSSREAAEEPGRRPRIRASVRGVRRRTRLALLNFMAKNSSSALGEIRLQNRAVTRSRLKEREGSRALSSRDRTVASAMPTFGKVARSPTFPQFLWRILQTQVDDGPVCGSSSPKTKSFVLGPIQCLLLTPQDSATSERCCRSRKES